MVSSTPTRFFWQNAHIEKRAFFESETMFATQSLTKQFSATATCSFTRKQQSNPDDETGTKSRARRLLMLKSQRFSFTQLLHLHHHHHHHHRRLPPQPRRPHRKEDRKIVNGQDVPSFEDISTAHFRISSGTFSLSLCFRI